MSNKKLLSLALALVADGFKNRLDLGGHPYFLHCYRVAEKFIKNGDDVKAICALLHDVVEDKIYSVEQLIEFGFPKHIMRVVDLLTHDKKVMNYSEYIDRISSCPIATEIKLEDLKDNSDLTRMRKELTDKDIERFTRYSKSYRKLKDVLECFSN